MKMKLKHPNQSKPSLILCYATLQDGERFVYSTGEKIEPHLWDARVQQPIRTKVQKDQETINSINLQLNRYLEAYQQLKNHFRSTDQVLTKQVLKAEFDQHFKNISSIRGFWEYYSSFCELNNKSGKWQPSTCQRYSVLKNLLLEFEDINGSLSLEKINRRWYADFKHFCEQKKKHQVNTFARNLGLLKTFLGYCLEEGHTKNDQFKKFVVKREVTHQEVLDMNEVKRMYAFDLSENKRLERVRDVFILGCLTGMRYSDYKRIKRENIVNDVIRMREVKDKSKTLEIPLSSWAKEILEKYNYNLPVISEQKFREYIKEAARLVGFTEQVIKASRIGNTIKEESIRRCDLISTHTARRTFITIMKNKGVPDKVIMKITGHRSLSSFHRYYRPNDEDVSNFMKNVWD
jgi:integrase